MSPIILQLDLAADRHHRAALTPQALADVLASALLQAVAQSDAGVVQSVVVACGDMAGLQAHQVLTLQIGTLEPFLGTQYAVNE